MPLITLLTRGFFILPDRDWSLPVWLDEALRYAPLGALVAVSVPDVLLVNGDWPTSWHKARWCGAAAATAWFFWRRSLIGTIIAGTSVMLALRLGLGW
jgi:branched-subunit amino acid transport protein